MQDERSPINFLLNKDCEEDCDLYYGQKVFMIKKYGSTFITPLEKFNLKVITLVYCF